MDLVGKKGAWINNYAEPSVETFLARARQVDYIIIKHWQGQYIALCEQNNIPYLVEEYVHVNQGPIAQGSALGASAKGANCIGVVVNAEHEWTADSGEKMSRLLDGVLGQTDKPIWSSIDSRVAHLPYPYQRILAQRCVGAMPMCYPKAFGQSPERAVAATLNDQVRALYAGKPIIPTIQTYDNIGAKDVRRTLAAINTMNGINTYTLGHATQAEWDAFVGGEGVPAPTPQNPPPPDGRDLRIALLEIRLKFVEQLVGIALVGNIGNVEAFLKEWKEKFGDK